MKTGKKEITCKNGNSANGNAPIDKPKLNKPVSKMTDQETLDNFKPHEILQPALEIRAKYRKKGIVIE